MLEFLAEQRIAEAIAKGELDDLPGAGRPLALDDDAHVPEELRLAYRILKNAGYVPPELETVNEIAQLERIAAGDAAAMNKLVLLKAKMERISAYRSSRTRRSTFSGRCIRSS